MTLELNRAGIAWRALTGAPEPALVYCAERERAIEAEVVKLMTLSRSGRGNEDLARNETSRSR